MSSFILSCRLSTSLDGNLAGVRPDYRIEVCDDILRERDGPMLVHGLQNLHNGIIILPGKKNQRIKSLTIPA